MPHRQICYFNGIRAGRALPEQTVWHEGAATSLGGMSHNSSQPWLHQHGREVQRFVTVRQFPLGLSHEARIDSCQRLNHLLADSQILYALYKKHHWLMRGPTFYQLHLLLDKHAGEQLTLIDQVAERVQTLGGVAVGDPRLAAEITRVPRQPTAPRKFPRCCRGCWRRSLPGLVAGRSATARASLARHS